jgi:hypothetical protein
VKHALEKLQLTIVQRKEQVQKYKATKEKIVLIQETMHIMEIWSENFSITQEMLYINEETMHKQVKDVEKCA